MSGALGDFTAAVQLNPTNPTLRFCRASIYIARGELDNAIADLDTHVQLNPEDANAFAMRAHCHTEEGHYKEAAEDLSKVILLAPDNPRACNNLAWLRAACPDDAVRDGKAALELATKACDLTEWAQWQYVDTLAGAYAEANNFEKALEYQKKAIGMNGDRKSTRLNSSH